ncbi:MAG: hypothetical protein AB7J35_02870 [Dehalococcoidia bacterium]
MTNARRRRNNAPVRPRRPATGVPDLLFAIGMIMLTMGFVFFMSSFFDDDLSAGDAGTVLARLFAGLLAISALLTFLMGILLLRDDRRRADHYVVPLIVGAIIGGIESSFFLNPRSPVLLVIPLLLLVFVLRPIRRGLAGLAQRGGG